MRCSFGCDRLVARHDATTPQDPSLPREQIFGTMWLVAYAAQPQWQPLGDRAIRFARPPVPARAIVRAVRAWQGVVDVVVAAEDVAAYFVDALTLSATQLHLGRHIAKLATLSDVDEPVREHVLRVRYDGADLDEVARPRASR